MARGDVYYLSVPVDIGPHMAVIVRERDPFVITIFGQSERRHGAHMVAPNDGVAREFRPHIVRATYFHRNNIALVPMRALPNARIGHIEDDDLPPFLKAAREGLALLGQIGEALIAAGHRCQCGGGCKRHIDAPCPKVADPAIGHSVMDWRITTRQTIVCRACWGL